MMFDKIKAHVGRHKTVYFLGAGITVAGITCFIMRGRLAGLGYAGPDTATKIVFERPLFLFSNRNKVINVVAVTARDGRGHPGYLVVCEETGDIFLSQIGAAVWAGVSDAIMSLHIRGKLPDVNGLHFKRLSATPAIAA
jgi:hypothetical protein